MTYYIYKATNKVNGKIYIGCTRNIGGRIKQHITASLNSNPVFHKAMQDYGVCNFVWEIIDLADFADEAFEKERYYIDLYNSFYPNGYNSTTGGAGAPGYTGKKVVCLDLDGNLVKTYESANSTEHDGFNPSEVLKNCKRKRLTVKKHMFMFEDDYLKNGSSPFVKPKSASRKSVVQCDLDGNKIEEFDSLIFASESTGTSRTSISACLNGTYKTANGFIWVYKNDFPIKDISKYKKNGKGTKIAQLDIDTGNVIAVFDSMSQAGRAIGKSYKNIQKVADNPNKTAYGFKWKRV